MTGSPEIRGRHHCIGKQHNTSVADCNVYDVYRSVTKTVAEIGTMICGSYIAAKGGNVCFVAGTLVLAAAGEIPIEEIEAGDYVWAWDEETGDIALKRVVETYVNETQELIHLHVNGEEIICTPSHPFYFPVKGWTEAAQLRAGDILVLVNGEYVVVEKVQHEILEAPIAVYNFNVEDYHTYYVASGVLVHNTCKIETGGAKSFSINDSQNGAFRAAKRYAGIPMSEQPINVVQSVDRLGRIIPGKTYIFENGIQIMQHSAGHVFEAGIQMTRHFNILGSAMHFFY